MSNINIMSRKEYNSCVKSTKNLKLILIADCRMKCYEQN